MHSFSIYQRPAIIDEVENPEIPINDITNNQNPLEKKAKLEVETFRTFKLYDFTKYYIIRRRCRSRARLNKSEKI